VGFGLPPKLYIKEIIMFEMLILAMKLISLVLATYITWSVGKKNYKTHPFKLATLLILIWSAVIAFFAQEFRTRNIIAQQINPPKVEMQMKQGVYKPNTNITSTSEVIVDSEAMIKESQKKSQETVEKFKDFETE
jgi:hypothetical protein